ncbi:MAG: GNAT family N-acetyltransferase [Pseudomonadota bacterium]|nr:GNAT family N-acetyltransferase [Pseudomonadota bacterium]
MVRLDTPRSPDAKLLNDALPSLAAQLAPRPPARRSWVPIRGLSARHRQRLLAHLLALSGDDRLLRFGYTASNERIAAYVEQIDFEHDQVFGVFDRGLHLIAQAHLAFDSAAEPASAAAEFGTSVLPRARGQGIGSLLFDHAVLLARNRGVRELRIHLLRQNQAMLAIVRRAGAAIDFDGGDATAKVLLPADTLGSRIGEMIGHRAAELDYRWKRRGHLPESKPEPLVGAEPPA